MVKAFSAPGKALLAGGYLVIDPQYSAYVTALSSRMHAVAKVGQLQESSSVNVKSPQFKQGEWDYSIESNKWVGGIFEKHGRVNPFIETTLATVFSYFEPQETFNIDITIYSDPGYHTQDNTLERQSSNGKVKFLYHEQSIDQVAKTGMGSSAGLVVVLTASLVSFFIDDAVNRENLIHNLAQIAHCHAQQKVGSGFDVAAAVFGSITYRRFDPAIIEPLMKHAIYDDNQNFDYQSSYCNEIQKIASSSWKFDRRSNSLPPFFKLLIGDVSGGSNTPKLVSKVLKWKQDNPQKSSELFASLNKANQEFIESIEHLNIEAKASLAYAKALKEFSKVDLVTLKHHENMIPDEFKQFLSPVRKLIMAIVKIRENLQLLTKLSGAEIEPPSQTELLDHCLNIKGCFGGVVPGAGGYDAIAVLVNQLCLDEFLKTTNEDPRFDSITWLSLNEQADGLIAENPENYIGLD